MNVDTSRWSGEGEFTTVLVDRLQQVAGIAAIRVEDAPASRAESDYNFLSNEVYVTFDVVVRHERIRHFGVFPGTRTVNDKAMTMATLERALNDLPEIGAPDYADAAMLQYLRTERIIPPYQTRGYKLVELVRIYEAGTTPRS